MPVTVTTGTNALGNVCTLTIAAIAPGPAIAMRLDCSLQRHAYLYLDGASAKAVNSILHYDITLPDVIQDLASIGAQLKLRLERLVAPRPDQAALHASLGGSLSGDYTAKSARVYRVDNTAMNPKLPPNHCYPISGPSLWPGVSQASFAAAAALRRVEVDMRRFPGSGVPGWIAEKWRSVQFGAGNGTESYKALSGARTHLRAIDALEQTILGQVSNVPWLIDQIVRLRSPGD